MSAWKQINIFESFQKLIFVEEFGFGYTPKPKYSNIEFHTQNEKLYYLDEIYVQEGNKYLKLEQMVERTAEFVFKKQLFISKSVTSPIFAPISLVSIKLTINLYTLPDYDLIDVEAKKWDKNLFEAIYNNANEVENAKVWCFEDELKKAFKRPCFGEKHQQQYYLLGSGVASLVKSFEYKDDASPLMEIKTHDRGNLIIKQGDKNLVSLPSTYDEVDWCEDLTIFKKSLEDAPLMTFIEKSEQGVLFVWKKLDDSYDYFIELYRLKNSKFGHKPYLLESIKSNDKQYYALNEEEHKLLGSHLIVRLVVKNKEGKVTNFTKGYNI